MAGGMKFTPPQRGKFESELNKAFTALMEQAKTDTDKYIKVDQGELRNSQTVTQHGLDIEIKWDAPYALKQYYTGQPSHDENELASLMWADKAQEIHGKQWEEIIQKGIEKGGK